MFVCPDCGLAQAQPGACPNDQTAMVASGDDVLLGTTVGAYRVAKLMGVGGMGRVYKGVHPTIGSRVAIKVLSRECSDKPDLVERFFSEARAVNLIRHESIVNVLEYSQLPDGRPYIIMEYLDGAPLADMVEIGPLPLGSMCRLLGEALDALAAAHAKGIVHRDLKPDNIYVTQSGRPKILDFGIAKLRPELGGSATQTGSLLGTPHYMSPEQAMGKHVDARTDIYAMGVILFECATGRRPFIAESLFDLLRQHVDTMPPPPRSLRPDIPPALEQVILYALAKDPQQRYGSAAELAQALQAASQGLPPEQWTPITPGTLKQLTAQRASQPSGAGWTPVSWPGGQPSQGPAHPSSHPSSHPGAGQPPHPSSHPPGAPGMGTPPPYQGYGPPSSVTGAAGQAYGGAPPRSKKGMWLAIGGGLLAVGGIATVVAVTAGGKKDEAAAAGSGSGSEVAIGSGTAGSGGDPWGGSGSAGSGTGTGGGTTTNGNGNGNGSANGQSGNTGHSGDDDPDLAELENLGKQLEALDPGANGGGDAAAMVKRAAAFRSGIPECDEWLRTMSAMATCPALASASGTIAASLQSMMDSMGSYRQLPQSARADTAAACKSSAVQTRQALTQAGCKVGDTSAPAGTDEPEPDLPPLPRDKPYPLTIKGFSADAWDFMAFYPAALAEAKKIFPDAQVARIDARGVTADGKVHLSMSDDFNVLFRFTSPSAAKRPADHPRGVKWEPLCMVQIIIDKDDAMVIPMQGFGCETPLPSPKCNARQVWARAIDKGAPPNNSYAQLWYGYDNGKWSFEIEGDDDVKGVDLTLGDGC